MIKVTELKQGDVFKYNGEEYTFRHRVMRNNGKYDVYCFDYKELNLYPEDEVEYVGKCDNPSCWEESEKIAYTRNMWNTIKTNIPQHIVGYLEKQYYADLFGKRGKYSERKRVYFVDNYYDVCNLQKLLETDEIVEVKSNTYESIDTTYSQMYETECYGDVELFVYVKTKNNKYYQLSQGKMVSVNESLFNTKMN